MNYRPMTDEERVEATKTWAAVGKPVRCSGVETTVVAVNSEWPGAVLLADRVKGFRSWNVDSLSPLED